MNRRKFNALTALYFTQFLSAFADNMILLVIANLLTDNGFSSGSLALVSIAFFLPYILLAPFVGPFADKYPKSIVLVIGNAVKACGILLLLFVDHSSIVLLMLCYFTVGVGAVIYSPAKYGILPELTKTEEELFKANSKIEAYTILAILAGIGGGGAIASLATTIVSSLICLVFFCLSILMTFAIPRIEGDHTINYMEGARKFLSNIRTLGNNRTTNYALIGTGSFWMSSAVLRIAVLAWIPVSLGFHPKDFNVSLILATTSIGIIIGAFLAPKLIPLQYFYKSTKYGFLMMLLIFLFPWFHITWLAIVFLLAIGFMGGVYIVPLNTVLQEQGKAMIGSGQTIAVQNLIENILMLVGSGIYYSLVYLGMSVTGAIVSQGFLFSLFLIYLNMRLASQKVKLDS